MIFDGRDGEDVYSDEHELPCPHCGKTIDMTDLRDVDEGDDVFCHHCEGTVEITGVDYSVTYTARRRDRWADFCEQWPRIGSVAKLMSDRDAKMEKGS